MRESIPLTFLASGQVAEVLELIGPPEDVRRLEELGLRSGVHVEIVRGGSPCIVRIGGSSICFRHDDRLRVLVSPRKTA